MGKHHRITARINEQQAQLTTHQTHKNQLPHPIARTPHHTLNNPNTPTGKHHRITAQINEQQAQLTTHQTHENQLPHPTARTPHHPLNIPTALPQRASITASPHE
jgi:hypothetical protein